MIFLSIKYFSFLKCYLRNTRVEVTNFQVFNFYFKMIVTKNEDILGETKDILIFPTLILKSLFCFFIMTPLFTFLCVHDLKFRPIIKRRQVEEKLKTTTDLYSIILEPLLCVVCISGYLTLVVGDPQNKIR